MASRKNTHVEKSAKVSLTNQIAWGTKKSIEGEMGDVVGHKFAVKLYKDSGWDKGHGGRKEMCPPKRLKELLCLLLCVIF